MARAGRSTSGAQPLDDRGAGPDWEAVGRGLYTFGPSTRQILPPAGFEWPRSTPTSVPYPNRVTRPCVMFRAYRARRVASFCEVAHASETASDHDRTHLPQGHG